MIEKLELNPSNLTEEETIIARARIKGYHDGMKDVIKMIDNIQKEFKSNGYSLSQDLIALKNKLGVMVYIDWKLN